MGKGIRCAGGASVRLCNACRSNSRQFLGIATAETIALTVGNIFVIGWLFVLSYKY